MASSKPMNLIGLLLIGAAILTLAESKSAKQKPASSYFNLCRRNDPKINQCIKDNIVALKPKLIKGIPELRLVPMDPMSIPSMTLSEGEGNFRFKQTMTNLTITGLKNFNVHDVDIKLTDKNLDVKITMTVPTLRMTALYTMEGRILVLPIQGNGDCVMDFFNVTTISITKGDIVKRGGEDYVDIQSVKWDIKVKGAKSHFNNLFNGDKALGDATNKFLNDNGLDAFETYKHLPEEAFGLVFKDLTNQVYKRYTVKELYLE